METKNKNLDWLAHEYLTAQVTFPTPQRVLHLQRLGWSWFKLYNTLLYSLDVPEQLKSSKSFHRIFL